MKLEFLGADHEVTGSCHYLKVGQTHVLIDCGMEQGADLYVNQEIPVNASEVDYVLVTHAQTSRMEEPESKTCRKTGSGTAL